jgi:hypothetical protein
MKEYQLHLDEYSLEGSGWFSKLTPESEWGKQETAQRYLENYWLPQDEYEHTWKPRQNKIFSNQDKGLPEIVFKEGFEIIALRGGCLFLKEDFEKLQQCFLEVGDEYFVIIENTFDGKVQEPAFQMKYPTTISWEELISGNFISSTIVESNYKEYFVFGDSEVWGKYSASNYQNPLDIIGFKPEYTSSFKNNLKQSDEEYQEIKDWLPLMYKQYIK